MFFASIFYIRDKRLYDVIRVNKFETKRPIFELKTFISGVSDFQKNVWHGFLEIVRHIFLIYDEKNCHISSSLMNKLKRVCLMTEYRYLIGCMLWRFRDSLIWPMTAEMQASMHKKTGSTRIDVNKCDHVTWPESSLASSYISVHHRLEYL